MKVVIQRVDSSSVTVNMDEISSIDNGLLILWGVEVEDSIEDVNILTEKILNLRVFSDEEGKMNKSIISTGGEILLVSQFTLSGNIQKGNRPSFINSQDPEIAKKMIDDVAEIFSDRLTVKQGIFAALMEVSLINDCLLYTSDAADE